MGTDIWLGSSADWSSGAAWSTGAAPASGDTAMINAQGSYAVTLFGTASVGGLTLSASGGEFYDAGILTVSGALAVQSGTLALAYGSIHGGTLALTGGQLQSTGGTLDGVAVQGALNLSAAGATMFIKDGLSVSGIGGSGAGSIAVTGGYAALDFVGSQTLNNATVSLGATGGLPGQAGPATLGVSHAGSATAGATLTLGNALWLRQVGNAGVGSLLTVGSTSPLPGATLPDTLINQGTITASVANATLDITGSGAFINQGTIAVSNGATLEIATAGFGGIR